MLQTCPEKSHGERAVARSLHATRLRRRVNTIKREHDTYLYTLILLSVFTSIVSFLFFFSSHLTTIYPDSQARLMIARRVIASPTAGFGQLGGTWLPLPQILMLPFIWSQELYSTGIAGSLISMGSFVITALFLYKTVYLVTDNRIAGSIATLVFITNPNVLFMQSTAMSELQLFALLIVPVYFMVCWAREPRHVGALCTSALLAALGVITRYEAWVLVPLLTLVIIWTGIRYRFSRGRFEGFLLGPCASWGRQAP